MSAGKARNNVLLSFAADAGETLSGYKENWTLQEAQVTGRTNPELKLQMTPSDGQSEQSDHECTWIILDHLQAFGVPRV